MGFQVIDPPSLPDTSQYGASHGVVADGRLQVSGQVGMDGDRQIVATDVAGQTRQAFDNLETILDATGCGLGDLTRATAYLIEPQKRFDEFHGVWMDRVESPYPCLTVVGVEELNVAGLLVEIEATAVLPD